MLTGKPDYCDLIREYTYSTNELLCSWQKKKKIIAFPKKKVNYCDFSFCFLVSVMGGLDRCLEGRDR